MGAIQHVVLHGKAGVLRDRTGLGAAAVGVVGVGGYEVRLRVGVRVRAGVRGITFYAFNYHWN